MASPEKKIMSSGYGPSKINAAPIAEPVRDWHVNGVAWANIDPMVRQVIPYELTDEGRAEKAAARPQSPIKVQVGADPLDKQLMQRLDAALRGDPNNRPSTALKEVADQYVKPGMTPLFLNPDLVRLEGTRGYKPIIDADGDPVRVGEMILSEIPTAISQQRIKADATAGRERLDKIDQTFEESSGRIAREGMTPAALADLSSISGSDFSDGEDTNPLTE